MCLHFVSLTEKHCLFIYFFIPACNDLPFFLLFYCMEVSKRVSLSVQGESTDLPFCWEVVVPICHRNKNAGYGGVSLPVINKIKVIYLPAYIVTLISS